MFTQLNPPIPLTVTDKGDGMAFAVIDYGAEHNLLWVTDADKLEPRSFDAGWHQG